MHALVVLSSIIFPIPIPVTYLLHMVGLDMFVSLMPGSNSRKRSSRRSFVSGEPL